MKTLAIKYADLLILAEQCRTRPGSEWIDAAQLAAMLTDGDHATNIKATAPDNIAEAIERAQKCNAIPVRTIAELAGIFGVTPKTLHNWKQRYNLAIVKYRGKYHTLQIIEQLTQFTQK